MLTPTQFNRASKKINCRVVRLRRLVADLDIAASCFTYGGTAAHSVYRAAQALAAEQLAQCQTELATLTRDLATQEQPT